MHLKKKKANADIFYIFTNSQNVNFGEEKIEDNCALMKMKRKSLRKFGQNMPLSIKRTSASGILEQIH